MAVYRFRVTFEDQEDVYREIEIRANQNFEDLHYAILQSINFDTQHQASFFMSDDFWRKGQEISLTPPPQDDDDDDRPAWKKKQAPPRVMKQCKIAAMVEDPHQKIVYIYDPKANWILYLELVKIVTEDAKASYPRCIKSVGAAPKQYKLVTPPPAAALEEDDDGGSQKETIFHSEEAYDEHEEEDDGLTTEEAGEESEEEAESEGEFGDGPEEFGGGYDEGYEER